MKLEKAIEILIGILEAGGFEDEPDDKDAIQLGIEALKRCQELESPTNYSPMKLLPGETQD